MASPHDSAAHFLHPMQWYSRANSSLVLVSDYDDAADTFEQPRVEAWNYYDRQNRYAWFTVASVDSRLPLGTGGLFRMGFRASRTRTWWGFEFTTGGTPGLQFVDMTTQGNMNSTPGAPPRLNANQVIEFQRVYDSTYALIVSGTSLCITAGSTPSSSASAGAVSLTTYEEADNQLWMCDGSDSLIGHYDIRSQASGGSIVVATPSDVASNLVQLGLESPRQESASQAYRFIEPALDVSDAARFFFAHQTRNPNFIFNYGLAQTGNWTVRPVNQLVYAGPGSLFADEHNVGSWSADGSSYPVLHLRAGGFQYFWDTSGPERMPFTGGLWGADEYPTSTHQGWMPVPRHMYDSALPTPSVLSACVRDYSGTEVDTTSKCAIPLQAAPAMTGVYIAPRLEIRSEQELFQVAYQWRSQSSDGTWGNWLQTYNPHSILTNFTPAWREPGWGTAWVPTDWTEQVLDDGRVELSEFSSIQLSDSTPRVQVRMSVRSFAYDASGVPLVGPAASITVDIAAKSELTIADDPIVGQQGLRVPYSIVHPTGPVAIHFDSITIGATTAVVDFDTTVSAASGTILVPWTAFRELDATWPLAVGTTISLVGSMSDAFGVSGFTLSDTLAADPHATAMAGHMLVSDLWTVISTNTIGIPTRALCVVDAEDAQHVIDMPTTRSTGIITPPALDVAGILDGEAQTTCRAMVMVGTSVLGDSDDYAISAFDVPRTARGITTLAFKRGQDVVIIPIEGNLSASYALTRDVATARPIGKRAFRVGSVPGASPELELTGTLYRGQLASRTTSGTIGVTVASTIQEACRIPADTTCVLRTAFGTCHLVRVVGVSVPRSVRDQAELTFSLVEVDE